MDKASGTVCCSCDTECCRSDGGLGVEAIGVIFCGCGVILLGYTPSLGRNLLILS
jgi:hypothetical protein